MHSIKNTVVAVVLLGASYGIYNVLTTPDPTLNENVSIDGSELLGPIGYSQNVLDGNQPMGNLFAQQNSAAPNTSAPMGMGSGSTGSGSSSLPAIQTLSLIHI